MFKSWEMDKLTSFPIQAILPLAVTHQIQFVLHWVVSQNSTFEFVTADKLPYVLVNWKGQCPNVRKQRKIDIPVVLN